MLLDFGMISLFPMCAHQDPIVFPKISPSARYVRLIIADNFRIVGVAHGDGVVH